jgi:hypothetical protein
MTSQPRYERNLPALLEDLYLGPSPDYRDELMTAVRRTRQRPAWASPERWLPVDTANRLALVPRYPIRAIGIALLVLALIVAGVLAYVGTHPPLRPALPFGPARNGSVVYALNGEIYLADPKTGASRAIVSGPEFDRGPLVSPDGTHLAFLRTTEGSTADAFDLVVANIDGSDPRVVSKARMQDADPAFWSPGSTFLVVMNSDEELYRYNIDGSAPVLVARHAMPRDFLPPDGRQLVYEDLTQGTRSLGVMNADGSDQHMIYTIPAAETNDHCDFGEVAASPDGKHVAFMRQPAGRPYECRVFVMNPGGSDVRQLTNDPDLLFETNLRWSPDSSMIAFDRWNGSEKPDAWEIMPIGVASVGGDGATRSVGAAPVSDGGAFEWSPDGKSIISVAGTVTSWPPSAVMANAHPMIIDVATGDSHEATWSMSSWPTWQRRPLD